MKVSELGEFGLIECLSEVVDAARDKEKAAWQQLILGVGDDAAVWQGDGSIQLATVDSLIQGVHFPSGLTSWQELGWRALAANLSDIAAMGGLPKYALVSLALPGDTEVEDVTALYNGMVELAQRFDLAIIGGDTSSAPLVVINITVLGSTGGQAQQILDRSAARPGDKVAVTGYLGAAMAGLEVLSQNMALDTETIKSLKEAFLKPWPRVAEGQKLVERGVEAAIDISDGLISDLGHICQASKVSARIEIDRLPVHPAVRDNFGDRAIELALSGGEDYELLFTASDEVMEGVKRAISCPVTIIGEITPGKTGQVTVVDSQGQPVSLPKVGWEHFTGRLGRA